MYGNTLECQGYLLPNNILTLQDQMNLFSYRTRMNQLKYNFSENKQVTDKCKCGMDMTNSYLYDCKHLNNSLKKAPYNNIFNGRVCEMKYLIELLNENQKKHEVYTQAQDINLSSH